MKNVEWDAWVSILNVRLIDGSTTKEPSLVMRRKVLGRWEYRLPTRDEEVEFFDRDAW
jgi:hypothetical protein